MMMLSSRPLVGLTLLLAAISLPIDAQFNTTANGVPYCVNYQKTYPPKCTALMKTLTAKYLNVSNVKEQNTILGMIQTLLKPYYQCRTAGKTMEKCMNQSAANATANPLFALNPPCHADFAQATILTPCITTLFSCAPASSNGSPNITAALTQILSVANKFTPTTAQVNLAKKQQAAFDACVVPGNYTATFNKWCNFIDQNVVNATAYQSQAQSVCTFLKNEQPQGGLFAKSCLQSIRGCTAALVNYPNLIKTLALPTGCLPAPSTTSG